MEVALARTYWAQLSWSKILTCNKCELNAHFISIILFHLRLARFFKQYLALYGGCSRENGNKPLWMSIYEYDTMICNFAFSNNHFKYHIFIVFIIPGKFYQTILNNYIRIILHNINLAITENNLKRTIPSVMKFDIKQNHVTLTTSYDKGKTSG